MLSWVPRELARAVSVPVLPATASVVEAGAALDHALHLSGQLVVLVATLKGTPMSNEIRKVAPGAPCLTRDEKARVYVLGLAAAKTGHDWTNEELGFLCGLCSLFEVSDADIDAEQRRKLARPTFRRSPAEKVRRMQKVRAVSAARAAVERIRKAR